ncbi:MAG: hypothetical protein ABI608_05360 [Rhizomicrobium sp.]
MDFQEKGVAVPSELRKTGFGLFFGMMATRQSMGDLDRQEKLGKLACGGPDIYADRITRGFLLFALSIR